IRIWELANIFATISRLALNKFPPNDASVIPAIIAPMLAPAILDQVLHLGLRTIAGPRMIPTDTPAPIAAPSIAPVSPAGVWPKSARTASTPSRLEVPPTNAPPTAPPTTDHHLLCR